MSEIKDFIIKEGELTEYKGKDKHVVIPNGVTSIGDYSFAHCREIESVIIPDSVTSIGDSSFASCRGIESVIIPDSVTSIGKDAFYRCLSLKSINLPVNLQNAGRNIFEGCPLELIKSNCKNVNLSLQILGKDADLTKIDFDFPNFTFITKEGIGSLATGVKVKTAEEYAYIWCFQSGPYWDKLRERTLIDSNEVVKSFAKIILEENKIAPSLWKKILKYIELSAHSITKETLSYILEILENKDKKIKKAFEDSDSVKDILKGKAKKETHPAEKLVEQHLVLSKEYTSALSEIKKGINYLDSDKCCDPKVLAFVASEYMKLHNPQSTRYPGEYKHECMPYQRVQIADEVASFLDNKQLQEVLMNLAFEKGGSFILPFARYADEKHAAALVTQMAKWDNWHKYSRIGRFNIIIARCGLLLSDTKAAILHLDSVNKLGVYAQMRGKTAEEIQDKVLFDFGFNSEGKKCYDLNGNIVSVRIAQDFKLALRDESANKELKSLPKKGIDETLYNDIKTEISNLNKNIKKAAKNIKKRIFQQFLDGKAEDFNNWSEKYLKNPIFTTFAHLIVWAQEDKTFILNNNKAIDCSGEEYVITQAPISVAHPIDMKGTEIESWQKYFIQNSIKQPFIQVWEPAFQEDQIKQDRYAGCKISAYNIIKKEEHGIIEYGFSDYSESYGFTLKDCELKNKMENNTRFLFGNEVYLELGEFTFKHFTRYVNHIIYLFDKWTLIERIKKDDVNIIQLMVGYNVAQILELINVATESKSINVTALLLNYKNERYGNVVIDEFVLDL